MSETVRVALGGLAANKLRTGLTILGLMIGVGSVIVLIAVGTGSSQAVEHQIDALGSNVLLVQAAPPLGGLRGGASASTLTVADANALENRFTAPDVKSASPVVNANGVTLTYNGTTYSPSSFYGTTPSYQAAHSYSMADGAWFTAAAERTHQRELVVRSDRRLRAVRRRRIPSGTPSESTAPTSPSPGSPTPRARTERATRTTSRSRR